jgi:hypothetical protein
MPASLLTHDPARPPVAGDVLHDPRSSTVAVLGGGPGAWNVTIWRVSDDVSAEPHSYDLDLDLDLGLFSLAAAVTMTTDPIVVRQALAPIPDCPPTPDTVVAAARYAMAQARAEWDAHGLPIRFPGLRVTAYRRNPLLVRATWGQWTLHMRTHGHGGVHHAGPPDTVSLLATTTPLVSVHSRNMWSARLPLPASWAEPVPHTTVVALLRTLLAQQSVPAHDVS